MKKYILILLLLVVNLKIYSQIPIILQEKLTNINSFSSIDIGSSTNDISIIFGINDLTNSRDAFMLVANDKLGGVSINLYKNFFWNMINIVTDNHEVFLMSYGFGEYLMDFEDKAIVRSQTNYEQKLPLVMKYLYTKYGTNYQIIRQRGQYVGNPSVSDTIDPIIYWEKNDGRVYSFTYTRMSKVSVSHLPLYTYRGFKNKTYFDNFIKMRNGDSLPNDAPSLATLTAEHKALEQKYGLLD